MPLLNDITGANLYHMGVLGQHVEDFIGRFRLSRAKAAKVLGVSENYVKSLITGVDVNTGNPINPREGTLRQLAAKMSEFGYPMTYEQLAEAAGIASALPTVPNLVMPPNVHPVYANVRPEQIPVGFPYKQKPILPNLPEPPDEEEIAIVRMIGAPIKFATTEDNEFWHQPRTARLRHLRLAADEWRDRQVVPFAKRQPDAKKKWVGKPPPGTPRHADSAAGNTRINEDFIDKPEGFPEDDTN